jgi:hypothetical protein
MLKLPPLINMEAVRVGAARVKVALAADHLDPERARLLRWAMRMAATNLRRIEWQQAQTSDASCAVATEAHGELAERWLGRMTAVRKPKRLYQMDVRTSFSKACKRNTS